MSPPPVNPAALCDQCSAVGLPILLARYTVVPDSVSIGMPAWPSGHKVKDIALGTGFHYALRTLRTGYVYLFYAKNARGSNQWECYAVGEDGCLRLQLTPEMAQPQQGPEFACSRNGHTNTAVHYIVIEQPQKCGATWIAFSETKWSNETINEYTTNAKLRDARMQTLYPAEMAKGAKHSHGAKADKAALESIIEYCPGFTDDQLPYDRVVNDFTWEDGSFVTTRLDKMSTLYPWHLRQGQAESTIKHMTARGKGPKGDAPPHVLALWDGIGIAHELNGFRNDAAGWIKKYGDERKLQIAAYNAIEGAKKALTEGKVDKQIELARSATRANQTGSAGAAALRKMAVTKNDPRYAEAADLHEQWDAQDVPSTYGRRLDQILMQYPKGVWRAEVDKLKAEVQAYLASRGPNRKKNIDRELAQSWPKYEERLDRKAIDTFKQKWDALNTEADKIIDRRTEILVKWLEAPLFIDTLEDFSPVNPEDGVRFEDAVGKVTFGMGSSKHGQQKIEQWVKEAKAAEKSNLVWRVIALNQQEGIPEIDAALQVIYGQRQALTLASWKAAADGIKWNKIADLGKKSLTLFNTQAKAANDAASGIAAVENTRGLDKLLMTIGGSWLKPFTWTVDSVNELLLRTLLMVRSGVKLEAAKALAEWDAVHSAADRDMLLRRLRNQDYYLSAEAQAEYEKKANLWSDLRKNAEVPDAKRGNYNAVRDARLALVVAVFEAFNLHKAAAKAGEQPNNEKVQAQLTAAKYATTAAALDVLSNFVKGLAAAGDRAVGYQVLKIGGGGLSVVASGYGAALDFEDAIRAKHAGDYRMATLFGIRAWFQGTSGVLTGLTALSYCSPLIETFGKKFGERLIGKLITGAAERLLLWRAGLMFASTEVSIFLLFISVVIWGFEDTELQNWCDRCAFGRKRMTLPDRYSDGNKEFEEYLKALKEVA